MKVPGWPESPLYSHAVISNGLVYVAGTIGANMTASPPYKCAGGIKNETSCALANIATVLEAAGTSFANLVDCTVFLGTIDDYAALNEVWAKAFSGSDPPARAAFGASGLALGAAAEVSLAAPHDARRTHHVLTCRHGHRCSSSAWQPSHDHLLGSTMDATRSAGGSDGASRRLCPLISAVSQLPRGVYGAKPFACLVLGLEVDVAPKVVVHTIELFTVTQRGGGDMRAHGTGKVGRH